MKIIETKYNGIIFRSRLEARWAVVFDAMSIPYHYEIEGFSGKNFSYLPDFWLPTKNVFVEVKGFQEHFDRESWSMNEDFLKCMGLAEEGGHSVLWLYGAIPSLDFVPANMGGLHFPDFYRLRPQGIEWLEITSDCDPENKTWEGITPIWDGNQHDWLYNKKALDAGRSFRFSDF